MRDELLAQLQQLLNQFQTKQDPDLILSDNAVTLARQLWEATPNPTSDLETLHVLGHFHWYRYLVLPEGSDQEDLQLALALLKPVCDARPDSVPRQVRAYFDQARPSESSDPQALARVGAELLQRALVDRDPVLLATAIKQLEQAVGTTPDNHPDLPGRLSNLGNALRVRSERTGSLPDLDRAIEQLEQAVGTTPDNHLDLPGRLSNLGGALQVRYERTGSLADLDHAIKVSEQAANTTPEESPQRHAILSNLGASLRFRYARTGHLTDLERAIELLRQAVDAAPANDPVLPGHLSSLGIALRVRYERTGDTADMDRAIEVAELAVNTTPDDHSGLPAMLNNLGSALQTRFLRTGNLTDLDHAITIGQQAVNTTPDDHSDRPAMLNNLGSALRARYVRTGNLADLDHAITVGGQAVDTTPIDHPDCPMYLSNLGLALQTRYDRTGNAGDLDHAIDILDSAVDATAEDHPNHPAYTSNLSLALQTRYGRIGNSADLDRAIEIGEQTVDTIPTDHPDRPMYLSNLGLALRARYVRAGSLADLGRAIDVGEQAVDTIPTDHPDRPMYLSNLGSALAIRHERTGNLADLDRAIDVGEQATHTTPADHSQKPIYLSNLGAALQTRYTGTGNITDLDRAIDVGEQAVRTTPNDHPDLPRRLSNLGGALRARYERTGSLPDLDRAIKQLEQAVSTTPDNHPDRLAALSNLGTALLARFDQSGDLRDLVRVVGLFRDAAGVGSAAPLSRARAALWWGRAVVRAGDPAEAVVAFETAIGLLGEVVPRSLVREDQEHQLSVLGGVGREAAAACLQADQPGRAVELFEQGRAVLFSQALDSRTDLTDLSQEHPELASRYVELVEFLNQPSGSPAASAVPGLSGETNAEELARVQTADADRRREADAELRDLIKQIRALPGHDTFLLPKPLAELLPAAGAGPVVLLNVTRSRSDALILQPDGVTVLPLPELSPDGVVEQVDELLAALDTIHNRQASATQRAAAEKQLGEVLAWLWDSVTGPVLDQLGYKSPPPADGEWQRVFWCPAGPLALLPVHAAGYHDTHGARSPATVIDRVVSSTIPTVRALLDAQGGSGGPVLGADSRLLVVAMPETPGERDLPATAAEAAELQDLFPGPVDVLGLPGDPPATRDNVLAALPEHTWAHFACHATSTLDNPSASALILADHDTNPLTMLDLTGLQLRNAELAFLSACTTARTGTALPDEPIHLAAACQLAGYRHVIATMWQILDPVAASIADETYNSLTTSRTIDPATALHHATRAIRNLLPDQPSIWASHTHTGR